MRECLYIKPSQNLIMSLDTTCCELRDLWDDFQEVIDIYLVWKKASEDPTLPNFVGGSPIIYHNHGRHKNRVSQIGQTIVGYDRYGHLIRLGLNPVGTIDDHSLRVGGFTTKYTSEGNLTDACQIPFPKLIKP